MEFAARAKYRCNNRRSSLLFLSVCQFAEYTTFGRPRLYTITTVFRHYCNLLVYPRFTKFLHSDSRRGSIDSKSDNEDNEKNEKKFQHSVKRVSISNQFKEAQRVISKELVSFSPPPFVPQKSKSPPIFRGWMTLLFSR